MKSKQGNRKNLAEFHYKQFAGFDAFLDRASGGPHWLKIPEIATVIGEALHFRDSKEYNLLAYCIMPNHVHLIVDVGRNDIPTYKPLFRILQSLKRNTALKANKILKHKGAFWQDESYDHVIRDEDDLERLINYVIENAVKSGLVRNWHDWQWTYVRNEIIKELDL